MASPTKFVLRTGFDIALFHKTGSAERTDTPPAFARLGPLHDMQRSMSRMIRGVTKDDQAGTDWQALIAPGCAIKAESRSLLDGAGIPIRSGP
jgi:hypothetical protein